MEMLNLFASIISEGVQLIATTGLGNLQNSLISNWIGPILFIVVAGVSIKFIMSRQFRELAAFLGIAAVVGLLVFNASGLFGDKGVFYKVADGFSNLISPEKGTK